MTGYGRAETVFDEYKITVEVKSVNNRYLDYNVKLYKQYSFLEEVVRDCVSSALSRGKVDIFIQFDNIASDDTVVSLNENVAKSYYKAVSNLADLLEIENDITTTSMTRFSDNFSIEKKEQDKEKISADARMVITAAINDLTENRKREGKRLKDFFDNCISDVKGIMEVIKERSPETIADYKVRIKERIEEILGGIEVDETRLLTEVGIFADKVNKNHDEKIDTKVAVFTPT